MLFLTLMIGSLIAMGSGAFLTPHPNADIYGDNYDDRGDGTFTGTDGDDQILHRDNGSDGSDLFRTGAGNDMVDAGRGDDTMDLGAGDDIGFGGQGTDKLFGGAGSDVLNGGYGDDEVYGGDGMDVIASGDILDAVSEIAGQDITPQTLLGDTPEVREVAQVLQDPNITDEGDDRLYGEGGNDVLVDVRGANALFGGDGHDILATLDMVQNDDLPDLLEGGAGDDILLGDEGDVITGGSGQDMFGVSVMSADDKAVEITDWDQTLGERLLIHYGDNLRMNDASTDIKVNGNKATISINGQEILKLSEASGADISLAELSAALTVETGMPTLQM